ncbi:hypothetical protein [Methylomonas albis]|uniref:DUF938 domain-containing protein n=1 Tax=Methylomonas albis TaxID=1854563 RepID=A0ABR9CYZ6_9GAMM|nr:DUF938 domain-containing protein [Methylomonas albis]MBD9356101.1 DUF938 domain-containing protein [Methylomonas albis]CAD6879155.1 hypothetical protein [Methylomonas albis]
MTIQKPFSQACENNKEPILQILKTVFDQPMTVWEIGSGTGQHACHFAGNLPHLTWQPTDRPENLPGIHLWRDAVQLANLLPPLSLDVADLQWPCARIDALFTANTLHIMSSAEVGLLFKRLANYLSAEATLCIYGPFNYAGAYTSESNARFDLWLKERDERSGIKDFETIMGLAAAIGLTLQADHAMPANNRLLVLQTKI